MIKIDRTSIEVNQVPCNSCTLCCRGDAIRLTGNDDKDQYKTVPHPSLKNELMLDHKKNGDCIYLEHAGCSIHDRKPAMCKSFDCRNIAKVLTFTQARRMNKSGMLNFQVWRKGKDLLKSM